MELKWHRAEGIMKTNGDYYADGKIDGVDYWLAKPEFSMIGWHVTLNIPTATYEDTAEQIIVQKAFDFCCHNIGWFPTIKMAKNVCQMLEDFIESKTRKGKTSGD